MLSSHVTSRQKAESQWRSAENVYVDLPWPKIKNPFFKMNCNPTVMELKFKQMYCDLCLYFCFKGLLSFSNQPPLWFQSSILYLLKFDTSLIWEAWHWIGGQNQSWNWKSKSALSVALSNFAVTAHFYQVPFSAFTGHFWKGQTKNVFILKM